MNSPEAEDPANGMRGKIKQLDERYAIFRAAKFGIAGASGFLVGQAILSIGVFLHYGTFRVASSESSSPFLVSLNVFAFAIGVTVNFFINERFTVANQGELAKRKSASAAETIFRLLKFQLVFALGNGVTILVQLLLLREFSLTPVLGSIIGAIIAYPVTYFISMRYVWRIMKAVQQSSIPKEIAKKPEIQK
jgi:putative flippase GtrA